MKGYGIGIDLRNMTNRNVATLHLNHSLNPVWRLITTDNVNCSTKNSSALEVTDSSASVIEILSSR